MFLLYIYKTYVCQNIGWYYGFQRFRFYARRVQIRYVQNNIFRLPVPSEIPHKFGANLIIKTT